MWFAGLAVEPTKGGITLSRHGSEVNLAGERPGGQNQWDESNGRGRVTGLLPRSCPEPSLLRLPPSHAVSPAAVHSLRQSVTLFEHGQLVIGNNPQFRGFHSGRRRRCQA